jgi:anti-sigma factor RsiW
MSSEPRPVGPDDLHGYVDGRLSPARRDEVEAHLGQVPADGERVAAWARLNDDLHTLFDDELARAVPEAWTRPPRFAKLAPLLRSARLAAAAATVVVFAAGGAAGWFAHEVDRPPARTASAPPIVYYAARAYDVYAQEVRHAVEVPADQEEHLQRWLSYRIGAPVRAPHLTDLGFTLMGGRLLPSGHTMAALFMYEDRSGARITLYVKSGVSDKGETAFQFDVYEGIAVCHWSDGPLGYALAGRIARDNLWRVAHVVQSQMERR